MTIYGVASLTYDGEAIAVSGESCEVEESGKTRTAVTDALGRIHGAEARGRAGRVRCTVIVPNPAAWAELKNRVGGALVVTTQGGSTFLLANAVLVNDAPLDLATGKVQAEWNGDGSFLT